MLFRFLDSQILAPFIFYVHPTDKKHSTSAGTERDPVGFRAMFPFQLTMQYHAMPRHPKTFIEDIVQVRHGGSDSGACNASPRVGGRVVCRTYHGHQLYNGVNISFLRCLGPLGSPMRWTKRVLWTKWRCSQFPPLTITFISGLLKTRVDDQPWLSRGM